MRYVGLVFMMGMMVACGQAGTVDPDLVAAEKLSITQVLDTFDPPTAGKVLFHRHSCNQCHTVDGSRRVGPSLNTVYGTERPLADGTGVLADEDYLRESILFSGKRIVKGYRGDMPRYQRVLKSGEVDVLIAYIKSLAPLSP